MTCWFWIYPSGFGQDVICPKRLQNLINLKRKGLTLKWFEKSANLEFWWLKKLFPPWPQVHCSVKKIGTVISPISPPLSSYKTECDWLTLPNNVHAKNDIRIEKRICKDYNSGTPSPSSPAYSVHRGLYLCNWNLAGHSPPPKYTISDHAGNPTLCLDCCKD